MCFKNCVSLFICCLLAVEYCNGEVFGSFDVDRSKSVGNDEVRCYCNMAECITTGYMCKSNKLGCFSDLAAVTSPSSIEIVTHGCLDLLDKSLQTTCRNLPGKSDSSSPPLERAAPPKSLLLCCTEDMCNDVDIPGPNRIDLSNQVFNASNNLFTEKTAGKLRRTNLTFDTEVFFRLATFTVPVLGAMILFMLVTLAIKLLRSDANEDRMVAMKLRQNDAASLLLNKRNFPNGSGNLNDFEASSKKVPLLYQYDRTHLPPASFLGNRVNLLYPVLPGHHIEKNKTNAKLNNVLAPYNTTGSSFEQPLLKINAGNPQANFNLGQLPLYNNWGGAISNNFGQLFCRNESGVSTTLNTVSTPQNVLENLATSVNIAANSSCSSVGDDAATSGNAAETTGAALENVAETLENVAATSGSVGATSSATSGCVGATSGYGSATNGSTSFIATSSATSGDVFVGSTPNDVTTTRNAVATSGIVAESVATSSNHLATADATSSRLSGDVSQGLTSNGVAESVVRSADATTLTLSGHASQGLPSNISISQSRNTSLDTRTSTKPLQHHPHNILPCSTSSFMGAGSSKVSIPTVFGPFACVTTQASSDEHPIYSLQKSSVSNEHPICSLNKSSPACGVSNQISCCSGCSNKCFDKNFSRHGCNLCQGVCNERLIASNISSTACNNFDNEDVTKLNYKKNLMPPFCAN